MKYLELLHVWCEKLVTWVDGLFGKYIPIDNQRFRFFLLCITVGCGVLVGKYTGIQFFHDYLNQSEYASKHLALIIYAIPTLALLWYFRTRDRIQQIEEIHEQINKTLDQIQQNEIISAIKHLNSDNIIRETIGAIVLMESINRSPKFKHLTRYALSNASNKFIRDRSRREGALSYLSYEEIKKMRQSPGNEYPCREKLIKDIKFLPLNHKEPESYKNNNSRLYRVCTIIFRLLLLVIVGCAGGLLLGVVLNVQFLFNFFTQDIEIAKHLINIIIGAPMFAILWHFRTSDARQQVNKMQEQASLSQKNIWQDRFNSAIEELGSDDITREEIGVQSLIMLPHETMEFDELITIAFESTLDEFQREISKKGVKYYKYEKAKNPDGNIELNPEDKEHIDLLLNKLGIEGKKIYDVREHIILMMQIWVQSYKESNNNNTTKS